MNSDKISVLMTVYNTATYLERSINSIINQTYRNFELIIIDDGSKDDSKKIINKYKNKKIKKFFLKKNFLIFLFLYLFIIFFESSLDPSSIIISSKFL